MLFFSDFQVAGFKFATSIFVDCVSRKSPKSPQSKPDNIMFSLKDHPRSSTNLSSIIKQFHNRPILLGCQKNSFIIKVQFWRKSALFKITYMWKWLGLNEITLQHPQMFKIISKYKCLWVPIILSQKMFYLQIFRTSYWPVSLNSSLMLMMMIFIITDSIVYIALAFELVMERPWMSLTPARPLFVPNTAASQEHVSVQRLVRGEGGHRRRLVLHLQALHS